MGASSSSNQSCCPKVSNWLSPAGATESCWRWADCQIGKAHKSDADQVLTSNQHQQARLSPVIQTYISLIIVSLKITFTFFNPFIKPQLWSWPLVFDYFKFFCQRPPWKDEAIKLATTLFSTSGISFSNFLSRSLETAAKEIIQLGLLEGLKPLPLFIPPT